MFELIDILARPDSWTAFRSFFVYALVALGVLYLYFSLALMTIARKTGEHPAYFAWIPIARDYLTWKIARTPRWTLAIVLAFYPGVVVLAMLAMLSIPLFFVSVALLFAAMILVTGLRIWWHWRIAERRGHAGWLSLLEFVNPGIVVYYAIVSWVDTPVGKWRRKR